VAAEQVVCHGVLWVQGEPDARAQGVVRAASVVGPFTIVPIGEIRPKFALLIASSVDQSLLLARRLLSW
jgi:hypothetical protein